MIKNKVIFILLLVGTFSEGLCAEVNPNDSTGTKNNSSGWSFPTLHGTVMGMRKATFETTKNIGKYLEAHPQRLALVCYNPLIYGTIKVCSIAFNEKKIPGKDIFEWTIANIKNLATRLNNRWKSLKFWISAPQHTIEDGINPAENKINIITKTDITNTREITFPKNQKPTTPSEGSSNNRANTYNPDEESNYKDLFRVTQVDNSLTEENVSMDDSDIANTREITIPKDQEPTTPSKGSSNNRANPYNPDEESNYKDLFRVTQVDNSLTEENVSMDDSDIANTREITIPKDQEPTTPSKGSSNNRANPYNPDEESNYKDQVGLKAYNPLTEENVSMEDYYNVVKKNLSTPKDDE